MAKIVTFYADGSEDEMELTGNEIIELIHKGQYGIPPTGMKIIKEDKDGQLEMTFSFIEKMVIDKG